MAYSECATADCGNPLFANGFCRKHYEKYRLARMPVCSVEGCTGKARTKGQCDTHYRATVRASHPECVVPGCLDRQKTLKSGYCERHLFRMRRHGNVAQPRKSDWGARESHPLYSSWHYHKRAGMCSEWTQDFWAFAATVGDRPTGFTLRKHRAHEVFGPDNWYWKEKIPCADRAAYAKNWYRANPRKVKNNLLKKYYGITLDQYNEMALAQNQRCDICKREETAVDKHGVPRHMAVDHCHATGGIRALLCSSCNKALGGFKDDPALLRAAADYVERYR